MRSHFVSSAKRQCSAAGRCFALSLTAGAPPQLRARSRSSRSIFSLRNWAASWPHTDLDPSPTRSAWRFHVPRIWIRSIKGRKFSVKRKTQNVGDDFVLRLFVVVPFPRNHFFFNAFTLRASHATLVASNSICDASSLLSPSFSLFLFLFLRNLPRPRNLLLRLPLPPSLSRLTVKKSSSPEFPTPEKSTISCIAARNPGKWASLN